MSLADYAVRRDKFKLGKGCDPGLAWPCAMCDWRYGDCNAEPCRTCDHNAFAVPDDAPASAREGGE